MTDRLQLALDLIEERKNFLTLSNEEYALLGPTKEGAMEVATLSFQCQIDHARKVAECEIAVLASRAMQKLEWLEHKSSKGCRVTLEEQGGSTIILNLVPCIIQYRRDETLVDTGPWILIAGRQVK